MNSPRAGLSDDPEVRSRGARPSVKYRRVKLLSMLSMRGSHPGHEGRFYSSNHLHFDQSSHHIRCDPVFFLDAVSAFGTVCTPVYLTGHSSGGLHLRGSAGVLSVPMKFIWHIYRLHIRSSLINHFVYRGTEAATRRGEGKQHSQNRMKPKWGWEGGEGCLSSGPVPKIPYPP